MDFHWNNTAHLADFICLNTCWIEKYFQLEKVDKELFSDPSRIFRNKGYILSVTENNRVLGVCALIKQTEFKYELARMAVLESEQGKGIGKLLLRELSKHAKQLGIEKLTLVSNTKLQAAVGLYLKDGFKVVSEGQHPVYLRGNIVMKKYL